MSFALGAREIKSLSGITLPGVSLGLTQVETRVDNRVSLSLLRSVVDGRACARPDIELTIVLHRAHVYVARELVGNDCAVAAVWHHELRHFAIYQETLNEAASEVERLMRAHYEDLILFGTEEEIRAQVAHEVQQPMDARDRCDDGTRQYRARAARCARRGQQFHVVRWRAAAVGGAACAGRRRSDEGFGASRRDSVFVAVGSALTRSRVKTDVVRER